MLFTLQGKAKCAEEIAFVSGAFKRSIPIEDVELLATEGIARGLLRDVLRFSNQDQQKVSELLNEKIDVPIVLTSNLLNSKIGEVIIERIARIIYPVRLPDKKISVPAIRAAVIKGAYQGKGKLNVIGFVKAYPNKTMAINLPAVMQVIDKVDSIADLVKFFSNSPLNGLKGMQR